MTRRSVAVAIDLLLGAGVIAGGSAAILTGRRRLPGLSARSEVPGRLLRAAALSRGAVLVTTVGNRNVRSPGYRLMGIRRADARTGGPVTVRSAIVQHWTAVAIGTSLAQLVGPYQRRSSERLRTLQPQLQAIQQQHRDDQERQSHELMAFYKAHDVNPFASCLPFLLPAVAPSLLALLTGTQQTLPERLAGVVIVLDESTKAR